MNPHVHKDVIIAYANGAEIEMRGNEGEVWQPCGEPSFYHLYEYRIKPEREWPVTSLNEKKLADIYCGTTGQIEALIAVANEAIKQYIIDTEKNV